MPLDKDIPNAKTFAKPEDDIRTPNVEDSSMYRQDDANSLLKDQTVPDERDHTQFKPRYEPGGKDVTPKTKYPYRDGIPNTHNARTQMGPKDIAQDLRSLVATLESAKPGTQSAAVGTLRSLVAKIAPAPKTASVDIYKRTVKEMALALLDDRDNTRTVVIVADLLEALGYILKKLGHTEAYRYCKQAENAVISNAEGKIAL